jgi:lipooligosaccharide transport system permease protein
VTTSFVNPTLFLLAMGLGLGSLIDQGHASQSAALSGIDYLTYLAPGLLAAAAMQVAATESTWPILASVKWNPTYPAMLATPLTVDDILAGQLTWIGIRLVQTTAVFFVVMIAFGAVSTPEAVLMVPAGVLTGLAFAAPICAFSATLERDQGLAALMRFGIIPMFLFSGVFFPVTQLPLVLRGVAYLTPLWNGVDLCRSFALGYASAGRTVAEVAYLLAWVAAGVLIARKTFTRRLVL